MLLINIVLILLTIHVLGYLIKGGSSSSLACGLFAYISTPKNHTFSWDKFNHLGLDNDERGGDSVGRVVGEDVVKYINKKNNKTTYEDYVINHKNGDPSHIAIGHTRKASVGVISEATAQPVVLPLPEGEGRFILVHNGTLYNHEALATKYGVEKAGKSDSMILAEIIMNHGDGVLSEYEGAAALIWRDDRQPDTLFVFKGESLNYSDKLAEERPLYFYQETDSSMYISSRCEGLYFIGGDADNVYDFQTNTLYEIFQGEIIFTKEIDRKAKYQVKKYVASPVVTPQRNINTGSGDSYVSQRSLYEQYGDDDDAYTEYFNSRYPQKVFDEDITIYNTPYQITYARTRYWFWEKKDGIGFNQPILAHGRYTLDEYGYKYGTDNNKTKPYYFFNGIMMKNKTSWKTVQKIFANKDFEDNFANIKLICKYSMYPVASIKSHYNQQNTSAWDAISQCAQYFSGEIKPLFSFFSYTFKYGDMSIRKALGAKTAADHSEVIPESTNEPESDGKVVVFTIPQTDSISKSSIAMPETAGQKTDALYEKTSVSELKDRTPDNTEDYAVSEEEKEVDETIEKEISDALSNIMLAFDASKNQLEILGLDSKELQTTIENLTKIEDILYTQDTVNNIKKKTLIVAYEEFDD